MSTSNANGSRLNGASSISCLLRVASELLGNLALGKSITTPLGQDEVDVLEQDALEVLRLIRSCRNRLTPISRIPPDVLILIPDFWDDRKSRLAITLTHVCRAWREIFTSCSSLWTDFNCMNAEKTRTYLERSKSSPINLWLHREDGLLPHDPFFQVVPHAIVRLESVSISTNPDHLQEITNHLSHPAPVLKELSIVGNCDDPDPGSALTTTLFGGDLSSLRSLHLQSLHTQLPWRNMVNLTSFSLDYVLKPEVSVGQLLDFFESAPRLLTVELTFSNPTFGAQNGRLVSLAHLKRLYIRGYRPFSLLLDHILVPAGATLETELESPSFNIEDHLPRSFANLKNLSNFNQICLHFKHRTASVRLTGPNGQVYVTSTFLTSDATRSVSQSLTQLPTSTSNWLEVINGDLLSTDLCQALLSIKNLRTLTLSLCKNLPSFILALDHDPNSRKPTSCPKLDRLVFRTKERFDIKSMVKVAAARASGGVPLSSVSIINRGELVPREGVMELLKHVSHVDTSFEIGGDKGE